MLHEEQFRITGNFLPRGLWEATDKISGNQTACLSRDGFKSFLFVDLKTIP